MHKIKIANNCSQIVVTPTGLITDAMVLKILPDTIPLLNMDFLKDFRIRVNLMGWQTNI